MKRLLDNARQIKSTSVGLILFMFGLYLILVNGYTEIYNIAYSGFSVAFGLLFIFSADSAIEKVKLIINKAIDFVFGIEEKKKKD